MLSADSASCCLCQDMVRVHGHRMAFGSVSAHVLRYTMPESSASGASLRLESCVIGWPPIFLPIFLQVGPLGKSCALWALRGRADASQMNCCYSTVVGSRTPTTYSIYRSHGNVEQTARAQSMIRNAIEGIEVRGFRHLACLRPADLPQNQKRLSLA